MDEPKERDGTQHRKIFSFSPSQSHTCIYLSMPEKETKVLYEEMEKTGGRQWSGSECEKKLWNDLKKEGDQARRDF